MVVEVTDEDDNLPVVLNRALNVRKRGFIGSVQANDVDDEVLEFESSLGPAAVKIKRLPGEPPTLAPEYEACKQLADATGLPLAAVYRIVQSEAQSKL